jgi:hypothetical protein
MDRQRGGDAEAHVARRADVQWDPLVGQEAHHRRRARGRDAVLHGVEAEAFNRLPHVVGAPELADVRLELEPVARRSLEDGAKGADRPRQLVAVEIEGREAPRIHELGAPLRQLSDIEVPLYADLRQEGDLGRDLGVQLADQARQAAGAIGEARHERALDAHLEHGDAVVTRLLERRAQQARNAFVRLVQGVDVAGGPRHQAMDAGEGHLGSRQRAAEMARQGREPAAKRAVVVQVGLGRSRQLVELAILERSLEINCGATQVEASEAQQSL